MQTADALVGTVLTFVGLPGLMPLPWWQTLAIFAYAMIKWHVFRAVAEKPVDLTPRIIKRA
jgi:hypothetical protein